MSRHDHDAAAALALALALLPAPAAPPPPPPPPAPLVVPAAPMIRYHFVRPHPAWRGWAGGPRPCPPGR